MAVQNPPRTFSNQGYLPNGSGPVPGAIPLLPNQGRVVQAGPVRILCVADVRGDFFPSSANRQDGGGIDNELSGNLRSLNDLARTARADYIIHTGDFGFYDDHSLDRIAEKTLRHVAQYSPLIPDHVKRQITQTPGQTSVKDRFPREQLPLSELPLFLNKTYTLDVPVYTVWGACEDVQVLEKLRSGEYKVDKLHIIDEAHSRLLEVAGVKLRLLGLGGAVVMHKLFDNGEGRTTIAGGQGTMWTTLLQMGELVDTANRVYDPAETRVLVTHASPAREGLLNQLSVTLKADFSISAGLHFRYGSSYNEFSVNPTLDHYRGKLAASKASFNDVWETVKSEVEPAVSENDSQQRLLSNALDIISKMPTTASGGNPFGGSIAGPANGQVDESAFKNMWNFNLADAAFGYLVLEIEGGRIATEMRAQGFNFAHRGTKPMNAQQAQAVAAAPPVTSTNATGGLPPPTRVDSAFPPGPASVPSPQVVQQPQPARTQQPQTASPAPPQPNNQQQQPRPQPPPGKTQGGTSARPTPSPAPAINNQTPNATASQPTPTSNTAQDVPPKPTSTEMKPNGTAATEKPAAASGAAAGATPVERKPSNAIFVGRSESEEEAHNCIVAEDKPKVQKWERKGQNYVAHFASYSEMQAALDRAQAELKRSTKTNKPFLRVYEDRGPSFARGGFQGSGRWQNNVQGGSQATPQGNTQGTQQQGGYRSSGASDSEGGRGGRGVYRTRGRGGDRGRGRGTRGGAPQKSDSAVASPAAAGAAPSGADP